MEHTLTRSVPLVSVCCITYNHANYIRQAIDGFLMQQTEFPVEIIIHDDASTDGTADIIRQYEERYPGRVRGIYRKENIYSTGRKEEILRAPFSSALGKYIAMCEGDDYWTHPLKLQKQVAWLEAHPECSLCSHRYQIEKNGALEPDPNEDVFWGRSHVFVTFENYLSPYILKTLAVVFRKDALGEYMARMRGSDTVIWGCLLKHGCGVVLNEVMGVYRTGHVSAYASRDRFERAKADLDQVRIMTDEYHFLGPSIKSLKEYCLRSCIAVICEESEDLLRKAGVQYAGAVEFANQHADTMLDVESIRLKCSGEYLVLVAKELLDRRRDYARSAARSVRALISGKNMSRSLVLLSVFVCMIPFFIFGGVWHLFRRRSGPADVIKRNP